jgi:hypothetical protein
MLNKLGKALGTHCNRLEEAYIVVRTCDTPSDEPDDDDFPVRANEFAITSCSDWSLVSPLSCNGRCYKNTCYAFDPVQDCLKIDACNSMF